MKNPYAIGKLIYLRPPEEEDIDSNWYTWLSNPDTSQYLAERFWPNTKEKQREFFNETKNSSTRMVLLIIDKDNDQMIGVCNLNNISFLHGKAEIALIIGEKEYQNGTYAIDVMSLLLKIGFDRLNMRNIITSRLGNNSLTTTLEKIFGFIEIGKFDKLIFSEGLYQDLVYSQLKKENWRKRNFKN